MVLNADAHYDPARAGLCLLLPCVIMRSQNLIKTGRAS